MSELTNHFETSSNTELRAFLSRFSTGPMAPHFAVMLNGAWGAGKTWFIKDFIETLAPEVRERVLYVSLYGVTKPAEIEDAFFQQLYPKLANKKLKYGYSIFKSFLKGALKIDLDGDGKDDGSVQISLPEVEKFASNPERTLLIFDDLERAKMPPEELLGYINHFVEHEGRRVIIIANEKSLLEVSPQFRNIKEKVIGRTFEIAPEPEAAILSFIHETQAYNVEPILEKRKKIVLEVFQRAGHRNLRNLRQALLDFANLWQCLPVEEMKLLHREQFKDRLVEEVISLSVEYRAGTLSIQDIEGLEIKSPAAKEVPKASGGTEPALAAHDPMVLHGLSSSRAVLLPSAYAHFFGRGHLPKELAHEGLTRGAFFTDEAKPAWQQLWHRLELTNDRFDALRARLLTEFAERTYRKPEELLHAFGILLQCAKDGLLERSTSELVELGKKTLAGLIEQNELQVDTQPYKGKFKPDFYSGYAMRYQGQDLEEFREFAELVGHEWSRRNTDAMQTRVAEWLAELRTDHKQWASRISDGDEEANWFDKQPIFSSVQPELFLETLLSLEPPVLTSIVPVLRLRYSRMGKERFWLTDEVAFWERLDDLLFDFIADHTRTTLSGWVVKEQVSPLVQEIAHKLRAYYNAFKEKERELFGDTDQ